MTTVFLLGDVAHDEGLRLEAYPDPLSALAKAKADGVVRLRGLSGDPWTIGYGHTGPEVREGLVWTAEQARDALKADLDRAMAHLDQHIPWWRDLTPLRQDVLANMTFNLGWGGLSKFVHTLELVKACNYVGASEAMLDSAWARQVSGRATRLAKQMRTGLRAP